MYLKRIFILIDDDILFFLEFLGGFMAAGLVYGTYYDAINRFDNGTRQVNKTFLYLNKKVNLIEIY